ncbi:MAG TPA: lytic transglycosylase domain-containing protein [Gammaproteobacteria bacterium]
MSAAFGTNRRRLFALVVLAAVASAQAQPMSAPAPVSGGPIPLDARSGADPRLKEILKAAIANAESFTDRFDAEVWLTAMSARLAVQVPNPEERVRILEAVHRNATQVGLAPELVLAVIDVESDFDRYAISSASALGLMQVMPFWVDELGYDDKNLLFDIEFNIFVGCRILDYYLEMEHGDMVQGLARYNGSVGRRWYADRVLDRLRTKWYRF